jgi:hypothetical protein
MPLPDQHEKNKTAAFTNAQELYFACNVYFDMDAYYDQMIPNHKAIVADFVAAVASVNVAPKMCPLDSVLDAPVDGLPILDISARILKSSMIVDATLIGHVIVPWSRLAAMVNLWTSAKHVKNFDLAKALEVALFDFYGEWEAHNPGSAKPGEYERLVAESMSRGHFPPSLN